MVEASGSIRPTSSKTGSLQKGLNALERSQENSFKELLESNDPSTVDNSITKSFINKDQGDAGKTQQEKLKETAEEMEGLFLNILVKRMRETVPDSGYIERSEAEKMFQKQLDKRYAQDMAKNKDLGIAEAIYEQFSQQVSSTAPASGGESLDLTG